MTSADAGSVGELEATMLQLYLKAARLRSWLARPQCPPAIRECKILLDWAYRTAQAHQDLNNNNNDGIPI